MSFGVGPYTTKNSSDWSSTLNCTCPTDSEPTSYDTWPGWLTKTPYPRSVRWNGTFLYACSLLVPPSACQMSTLWPLRTNGVKRSPSPYTLSPTPSDSCVSMKCRPSASVAKPVPRLPTEVRVRPPALKSSRHGASVSTFNDNSPEMSSTAEPSRTVLAADCSAGVRANSGRRGARPPWWVVRTPITPSAGDQQSTVSNGPLSVSPRCVTRPTGAYSVSRSSVTTASATDAA